MPVHEAMMSANLSQREASRRTGWLVMGLFLLGFSIIISVNVLMAFLASGTWTGLIVKNSYVASQDYQREIHRADAQRATGVTSDLTYANGVLTGQLFDADGQPLTVRSATLSYGRITHEHDDASQTLVAEGAGLGVQALGVTLDLPVGEWTAQLRATADGISYRRDFDIFVTSDNREWVE